MTLCVSTGKGIVAPAIHSSGIPATWKGGLSRALGSRPLQLDAASPRASVPAPTAVRTMARNCGHALNACPIGYICCERLA